MIAGCLLACLLACLPCIVFSARVLERVGFSAISTVYCSQFACCDVDIDDGAAWQLIYFPLRRLQLRHTVSAGRPVCWGSRKRLRFPIPTPRQRKPRWVVHLTWRDICGHPRTTYGVGSGDSVPLFIVILCLLFSPFIISSTHLSA